LKTHPLYFTENHFIRKFFTTAIFNSQSNLRHLSQDNGLLRTSEGFLLFRKAIGHSNIFDTSIVFDTLEKVLNPMGGQSAEMS